jgi:hypothetical protein
MITGSWMRMLRLLLNLEYFWERPLIMEYPGHELERWRVALTQDASVMRATEWGSCKSNAFFQPISFELETRSNNPILHWKIAMNILCTSPSFGAMCIEFSRSRWIQWRYCCSESLTSRRPSTAGWTITINWWRDTIIRMWKDREWLQHQIWRFCWT